MKSKPYTYLFRVQYLGFRYHGWQKQPGVKTVQEMLQRAFKGALGIEEFNILGSGRTDTGVSCLNGAFELFSAEPIEDLQKTLKSCNTFLPDDIRLLSAGEVGPQFNVIQDVVEKEYRFYFSYGTKPHPFSAPFTVVFPEKLDVALMREGAKLFEGTRDFRNFCTKPKPETIFKRFIDLAVIDELESPDSSWELCAPNYCFRVRGKGFLRNQVRIMMGALYDLGKGKMKLEELENALKGELEIGPISRKALPTGLVLYDVIYEK
ncbi:tRNA pseudouridine(38-40) synthase TruA [Echinicola marina]|uniref:tRNA pseudouridine synthase A n=1 Tax=Echinicola marina TaxID=2859768 RepID=UPI001CF6D37B|nr:tRNA pseudouridine(38-40) synthase TruA [Echinicola marina]UCS92948.1 tRNA pseudouridine(38-40) synthase TruA [Echinicola marina]